jgi:hypothetical protein
VEGNSWPKWRVLAPFSSLRCRFRGRNGWPHGTIRGRIGRESPLPPWGHPVVSQPLAFQRFGAEGGVVLWASWVAAGFVEAGLRSLRAVRAGIVEAGYISDRQVIHFGSCWRTLPQVPSPPAWLPARSRLNTLNWIAKDPGAFLITYARASCFRVRSSIKRILMTRECHVRSYL